MSTITGLRRTRFANAVGVQLIGAWHAARTGCRVLALDDPLVARPEIEQPAVAGDHVGRRAGDDARDRDAGIIEVLVAQQVVWLGCAVGGSGAPSRC